MALRNARRYDYGGGAFLVPYFLALIFIGVPILAMEISLGQHCKAGDLGVFGDIHPRFRGIGIVSSLNSFIVVCYYSMLIGWTTRCFISAFTNPDLWSEFEGEEAFQNFLNLIVGMDTLEKGDMRPTRLVFYNVCCLALVWIAIFFGTAYGLEWTGRISYVSMGVPFILMVLLLIRSVTLEGAGQGMEAYIGSWEFKVLVHHPDVWSTAVSQVFFSLGVTFGMFTAFGSHCPDSYPAYENSLLIATCNSAFSIISGLSIFAALGYLAHQHGVTVAEIAAGGPALVFGAYPDVLETIPGGIFWIRLFFFDMFLLGIDSAFAIVEAIVTVLKDTSWLKSRSTFEVSLGVCVGGFLSGLVYATDSGIYFLDSIDFYVNFCMLFVGCMECTAVGWFFGREEQYQAFGKKAVYIYMASTLMSVVVAIVFLFGIQHRIVALFVGLGVFISVYAAGLVLAVRAFREHERVILVYKQQLFNPQTDWQVAKDLMMHNMYELRTELQETVVKFPLWVCCMIKHFIPQILLVLLVNLAVAKKKNGLSLFGHYGGYPFWPFQVLGIGVVLLSVSIVAFGLLRPDILDYFAPFVSYEIPTESFDATDSKSNNLYKLITEKATPDEDGKQESTK